jgi:hypothetical protein
MDKSSFHDAAVELLREAFEGVRPGERGTWFVEGTEAILPTLKEISAAQASQKPNPGLASIGAHTRHLVYMLTWGNACHGGERPEGDWNSTWSRDEFSAEEWDSMRAEVETRYRNYFAWFRDNTDWTHELGVISPLSMLPHVAYHLGAIRQLLALVR